jgi:methyl-accepting chemotaxis protein
MREPDAPAPTGAEVDPAEVVAAWAPALPALSRQVGEAAQQMEAAVHQVCQSFRGIARRARETAQRAGQLLGHDEGGRDAVGEGVRLLQALLARLDHTSQAASQAAQQTVEQTRQLQAVGDAIELIRASLTEVDAVSVGLRVLAINARIEASRAGAQGTAFGVVAAETVELARRAGASSGRVRTLVEGLHAQVAASAGRINQWAQADLGRIAQARDEARAAMEFFSSSHREMRRLAQESAEGCRALAAEVSEAITGLQFQDAVNQRLGHVIDALAELSAAAGCAGAAPGGDARAVIDRLLDRCTMQQERQVLADSLGQPGVAAGRTAPAIELF